MAWTQQPNSGSLWKNEDRKDDKHPNAKGSALIDGTDYWVSAWTRETKEGVRYQSLTFRPKDQPERENPPQRRPPKPEPIEDEIPF